MSIDHKPSLPDEMERIKKAGGEVKNPEQGGPYRVYKMNENSPALAVARSLGDCFGHDCGVSEEPQVSYRILDDTDEFIVMGSDGIWDVMNSGEIVVYVCERTMDKNNNNRVDRENIAQEITEECRKRWIIINKFKDEQVVERIRSDGNMDPSTKTTCINNFVNQVREQCNLEKNTQNDNENSQPPITNYNQPVSFTGRHNIDDITCCICFFK